ncbi:MAG: 3-deoxy-manno-octulosonate cytidylyltransferase [Prevotella sp.]|nr:3-deoxy-manno-octulosonate cytidylyltransferase [Prevotella sp.]
MKHQLKAIAIIPARYASTRFPGKPLAMLGGKTVIQRVYEKAVSALDEAYVATDDDRIYQAVCAFGGKAVMTSNQHRSGTDRIAEAARIINTDADVIVNIQGDEPFIHRSQIEAAVNCFVEAPETQIATLGKPFTNDKGFEALSNPNSPKLVTDLRGFALYFSRSIIPYIRGKETNEWIESHTFLKHIGLYAYRSDVLQQITLLPPSPLEMAESLEQLRWLQNGYRIRVATTDLETVGIDTPEDLEKAASLLATFDGEE